MNQFLPVAYPPWIVRCGISYRLSIQASPRTQSQNCE
jgi:hypothetical protein